MGEGIGVQSRVPRVMNHALSSPRNELERSVVARPVRQINNVICSLGSRPIRSGPKDFVRTEGRVSEFRTFANQNGERKDERGSPFPASISLSRSNSTSFPLSLSLSRFRLLFVPRHHFPFATFIFSESHLSTTGMLFKQDRTWRDLDIHIAESPFMRKQGILSSAVN